MFEDATMIGDRVEASAAVHGRGMMKRFLALTAVVALSGCTWQVQMMPRDSGKIYVGSGQGDGMGGGTMVITIEDRTYSGAVMRTGSDQSFGLFQTYGGRGGNTFGTASAFGGTIYVKALLSSPDNHGLRCDLQGDGMGHLGGICVDDLQRVYDVLAHR